MLIGQLLGSLASCAAVALLVVGRHLVNRTQTHFCGLGLDMAYKSGCHARILNQVMIALWGD